MAVKHKPCDGWSVEFTIPRVYWIGLGDDEREELRAKKRGVLRRDIGKRAFTRAKKTGAVWKVGRFALLVGVSDPAGIDHIPPMHACETVKPLVDAGTDASLWVDDDAAHRIDTTYFTMKDRWRDGQYHIQFIVLPFPKDYPLHRRLETYERGLYGERVVSMTFYIPHKLWITSNFDDSDLIARQQGSDVYGSRKRFMGGVNPENRRALRGNLMVEAIKRWEDYKRVRMDGDYSAMVGIAYPSDNDADPDNASETVSCVLGAGKYLNRLPSLTGTCGEVSVYRLPSRSRPTFHDVKVTLFPRERNLAQIISGLCVNAWGE